MALASGSAITFLGTWVSQAPKLHSSWLISKMRR